MARRKPERGISLTLIESGSHGQAWYLPTAEDVVVALAYQRFSTLSKAGLRHWRNIIAYFPNASHYIFDLECMDTDIYLNF